MIINQTIAASGGDDGSFKAVIEGTATHPTLPSDLTTIRNNAFYEYGTLALTSLPSGVTSIGDYAFNKCTNLVLTSLPSGVTSIGANAFRSCTNLALASLPSGVTSIGVNAFASCYNITLTSLPSGLTKINDYTFDACTNLALTSLPSGVTTIGNSAFRTCKNLAIASLPSGVTKIDSYAFAYCTSIASIECNGAITTLGNSAFASNSSNSMQLASVSFPNMAVYSLGTAFGASSAAYACQQLAFADVGKTSSIAANAFANCYKLQTLVLRKTGSICTLANVSAFTNTPMNGYNSLTGTVYVPSALISTYQTASNWSTLYSGGTLTFAAIEGSQYEL